MRGFYRPGFFPDRDGEGFTPSGGFGRSLDLFTSDKGPAGGLVLDGPSTVYSPTLAAHWTSLSIEVPTACWGCQDTSGGLAPAIGSVTLAENGSPTYQQSVTGWTRKFVGFTDATASQRFGSSDAALDLAAGESYAALAYIAIENAAGTRRVLGFGGDTGLAVRVTAAGLLVSVHNADATSVGAQNHETGLVYPFIVFRNATANTSGTITTLESIAGVHDESAFAGGVKGIGSHTGATVPTMKVGLLAVWKGAAAETITATTLTTLGW